MPGKNELRAQLLATFQAPLQKLRRSSCRPPPRTSCTPLAAKEREGQK